jgi:hypothetical protein
MRTHIRILAAVGIAALAGLGTAGTALAHDVHTFGPYTIALGWVHEPAYVGFDNAVQVLVKQGDTAFTNLTDKDLTVTVSLGRQTMDTMPMLPTADPDTGLGIPGEYEMHFIPTAPGAYTFHLKGAINGTPVDETVTAGDKTFDEVHTAASAQWPNQLPSASELSTLVNKQAPRISAAASAGSQAQDAANHALAVGVVALVIAVLVGLVSLTRGRQPRL